MFFNFLYLRAISYFIWCKDVRTEWKIAQILTMRNVWMLQITGAFLFELSYFFIASVSSLCFLLAWIFPHYLSYNDFLVSFIIILDSKQQSQLSDQRSLFWVIWHNRRTFLRGSIFIEKTTFSNINRGQNMCLKVKNMLIPMLFGRNIWNIAK